MNDHSIIEAKQNTVIRNQVISEKTPFVIYMVSQTMGRYVETENDIEFLIGLEALNEAIDKYDPQKGAFESFAGTVIKNRVRDELRQMSKRQKMITIHEDIEATAGEERLDLMIELNEFSELLKKYRLDFDSMAVKSPAHKDTRIRALKCAARLSKVTAIAAAIQSTLKLPIAMIVKHKLETRRFLYAHQRYVLFASLAFIYQFSQITAWIVEAMGGERDEIL
ncbi:MAG: polymerase sigma factor [Clostridiales bacterium]|jgi:RNA polymerase sigma factor|nr:polymerase sigma factor [Clostridiales bacterium]MDN5298958.1 polymerase sigma factor [Clostridiales bacterium]